MNKNEENSSKKPEENGSGNGNVRVNDNNRRNRLFIKKETFKGACEALEGCTFDVSDGKNTDKYTTNIKKISVYVLQKFTDGGDIRSTIEKMKLYKIEEPDPLSVLPSEFEREVWKREVAEFVRRKAQLKTNVRSAYTLVWGQCTLNLQNKLRSLPDFKTFDDKYDVLELLKGIKSCTYQIEQKKDPALALVNALKKFFLTFQGRGVTIESHYERFIGMMEVVEGYGGSFPVHNKLVNEELEYYDENERTNTMNLQAATETARERLTSMLFLLSVGRSRYGSLLTELETDKVKGFDNYPKTLDEAYSMIISYSSIRKFEQRREASEDVSFVCKEQTFDKSKIEC